MRDRVRKRTENISDPCSFKRFRQIPESLYPRTGSEENLSAAADHQQRFREPLRRRLDFLSRNFALRSRSSRLALCGQWTFTAARFLWQSGPVPLIP